MAEETPQTVAHSRRLLDQAAQETQATQRSKSSKSTRALSPDEAAAKIAQLQQETARSQQEAARAQQENASLKRTAASAQTIHTNLQTTQSRPDANDRQAWAEQLDAMRKELGHAKHLASLERQRAIEAENRANEQHRDRQDGDSDVYEDSNEELGQDQLGGLEGDDRQDATVYARASQSPARGPDPAPEGSQSGPRAV